MCPHRTSPPVALLGLTSRRHHARPSIWFFSSQIALPVDHRPLTFTPQSERVDACPLVAPCCTSRRTQHSSNAGGGARGLLGAAAAGRGCCCCAEAGGTPLPSPSSVSMASARGGGWAPGTSPSSSLCSCAMAALRGARVEVQPAERGYQACCAWQCGKAGVPQVVSENSVVGRKHSRVNCAEACSTQALNYAAAPPATQAVVPLRYHTHRRRWRRRRHCSRSRSGLTSVIMSPSAKHCSADVCMR